MEFNYQRNASTTNYVMLSYELNEHDWKSLYLKSWPEDVIVDGRMINDTDDLKWLIEEVLCIGKVDRIDAGSRKNRSGKEQKYAFIHFHMWDVCYGKFVRDSIDHKGSYLTDNSSRTEEPFRTSYGAPVFFRFYKNLNPVATTDYENMNHQQTIMRCKKLEEAFKSKNAEVDRFVKTEYEHLTQIICSLRYEIGQLNNDIDMLLRE